jgi:hypothetical protein
VAKKKKSLPRYIFSIKSLYYFRYTLPPDIAEVVNKRELRYALQTGYIRKAKIQAHKLIKSVNVFVQKVRQEIYIIMKLSETQIQSLLDQHLSWIGILTWNNLGSLEIPLRELINPSEYLGSASPNKSTNGNP